MRETYDMNANDSFGMNMTSGKVLRKYTTRPSEKDKMVEIQLTVNLKLNC